MYSTKEKMREYQKKWRERNKDYYKKWLEENPEYHKDWSSKNPGYQKKREKARLAGERREQKTIVELRATQRALNAKRRASKHQRTPRWFGEFDSFVWKEAMHLCGLRNKTTTFKWHADHIIPLQGRLVSGLHVWNNCQVIPESFNTSKNNRFIVE